MEDDGKEPWRKLFGEPGEPVPAVDFADMKAMLAFRQDVEKRNLKGGQVIIGMRAYQSVCSPGADVRAISYRLTMLAMLGHYIEAYPGGNSSDAALKAAAKMELTWLPDGGSQGFPFDVMKFLEEAQAEAA